MKAGTASEGVVSIFAHEAGLIIKTMRPIEWIKNLFVFAPIFFAHEASDLEKLALVSLVFLSFSLMSSAVYIFNDIHDRELDRTHPTKRHRPIASGALSVGLAAGSAVMLAVSSLALAAFSPPVVPVVLAYGGLNILYSLHLKHIVILDVFAIAVGFVLRVFAGGLAVQIEPSSWLILATFLLSLFLGLAKRRHELLIMKDVATSHRPVLEQYTISLVDVLTAVVTPVTLLTYILYTLDAATTARFHTNKLYLTALFVVFGIFRYLYLVHRKDLGGSPTQLIITDGPLRTAILAWVAAFTLIVYVG